MNYMELEILTAQIYKRFEVDNPNLLKENPQQYWNLASKYKEEQMQKEKYKVK